MTGKTERFLVLDAWRGIAALLVAMEHLNVANPLHKNGLVVYGFRFVDFFFVLSGFVIAHAYRDRLLKGGAELRSFAIRRIGRLWPMHVVALLALVAFEVVVWVAGRAGISLGHEAFGDRNSVAAIGAHLVMIQGLGVFHALTWNGPSWSISTEMFAYFLFAAICAFRSARSVELAALVALVGSALVIVLFAPHGMGSTYDFGVFRCVYGFMTGVLVRWLYGRWSPRVGTIGEVVVVALIAAGVIWLPNDEIALLITPLFALAVWVFAAEDGAISHALRGRVPQALGAWSYSIYIVHILVAVGVLTAAMLAAKHGMHVFERIDNIVTIVGPAWFTTLVILGYLALVIAVSSQTYRFVELPGQRLFGRWAKARPSTIPSTSDSVEIS